MCVCRCIYSEFEVGSSHCKLLYFYCKKSESLIILTKNRSEILGWKRLRKPRNVEAGMGKDHTFRKYDDTMGFLQVVCAGWLNQHELKME